jgi:hypothetical protein
MVNRNSAAGNFNIGTHTVPGTWPFNYDYHCSFCNEIISLKKDLCFIDFDSISQRNKLVWEKGDTTDIAGYIIYRENSIASQFDSLDYVPVDSISEYIDHTANPYNKAWRYRLISVSICGDNPYSNLQNLYYPAIYTTLFLQQGMSSLNSISLNWYSGPNLIPSPGYGPWIQSYFIYHGSTPGSMQLIDSVSSLNYTYTHTSPVPGPNYYQIEMRSTVSCTSSMLPTYTKAGSNIMGTLFTGLSDIVPESAFSIQPNPAKEKFSILLSASSKSIQNIVSIYTMNGQSIKTVQLDNTQPEINVSELTAGVYMVVLENEKGINRQKLVVH